MRAVGKYLPYLVAVLALLGLLDSLYLTVEHYRGTIPPCAIHWWITDCGRVLRSQYSVIFGVPLALIGAIHYSIEFILSALAIIGRKRWAAIALTGMTIIGFASSLYFVYLMFIVIRAICWYCLGSALASTLLFILTPIAFPKARLWFIVLIGGWSYRYIAKPIFFRLDPESVHVNMVAAGEKLGIVPFVPKVTSSLLRVYSQSLTQTYHGVRYDLPVGLAAGFDYEARLTQILGSIGFGFQTVGTITNGAYEGNIRPMLGRLPQSRSLLVNKGFKNPGADAIVHKLMGMSFSIPVGISVGRTNSRTKSLTQNQSVIDICRAFEKIERSKISHSYYELNISCPNLFGNVSFYPLKNLEELLKEVDKLKLSRPVYIKMPIEKSLTETYRMLTVISRHNPVGVIIGNLQKNRNNPLLVPEEVAKFPVGYFSGKPTFDDSNERIKLCFRKYGARFTIIGCGGVFNGRDAFEKIRCGASLVQLITGMIYEGPLVISQIHLELLDILRARGFSHVSEAIGCDARAG